MLFPRRRPLKLEALEDRQCPTVNISFLSGDLYIMGAPNAVLAVTETGPRLFQVKDGTAALGTYLVSRNLNISLSRHPEDVNVQVNATGLGGNLYMSLGTGDSVGPPSTVHVFGGRIGGNVTIVKGNGNETLDLGIDSTGGKAPVSVGGSVSAYTSTSAGVGGAQPRDTLFLQTGSSIGLDLSTNNVDSVFLATGTSVGR